MTISPWARRGGAHGLRELPLGAGVLRGHRASEAAELAERAAGVALRRGALSRRRVGEGLLAVWRAQLRATHCRSTLSLAVIDCQSVIP